ncbi:MAG: endonuclease III [Bacteroidetes bacterium GWA2_30_7]|nr:MAG: endonuclease III [Bacteroidetes bacterium GWA2_30_7]
MKPSEILKNIIPIFEKNSPNPKTELEYIDPFQLAVAVILSAQCTDVRVNMVTPKLFKVFPTAEKMAKATIEEVFDLIKSISYPNNKAKHLIGMSKMLIEEFNNQLPSDIELLQKLPGVGRKTANVLASVLFNKPTFAVDTHVFRVCNRIGLTINAKNPLQTEQQILAIAEPAQIPNLHHWLILHGRYVCKARKPLCEECLINKFCNYFLYFV